MATAVKVSDELIAKARIRSKIFKRSIAVHSSDGGQ